MNNKQYLLVLLIALMGGIIGGGMVSYFRADAVFAQRESTGEVVKASDFQLVDTTGNLRGRFFVENGQPHLDLLDPASEKVISLNVVPRGGLINIFDEEGNGGVNLAVVGPSKLISMMKPEAKPSIMMTVSSSGHPGLILYGEREKPSIVIYDDLGFKIWEQPDQGD